MASGKKLTQYDPIATPDLDLDDVVGLIDKATGKWRQTTIRDILTALDVVLTVNGKKGAAILNTDDLSDAGKTNKFVSQTDKDKLAKIKTTGAANRFFAEDGNYYENTGVVPTGSYDY